MSTLGQPPPISPPDIDPPSTTEAPPPCSTPPPPKPKVPPIPPPQYRWADTYLSSTPCNSWDILDYLRRSGDAGPFDKLVHSWVKALTALAKADGDGDATDEERAKAAELYARYDALVIWSRQNTTVDTADGVRRCPLRLRAGLTVGPLGQG